MNILNVVALFGFIACAACDTTKSMPLVLEHSTIPGLTDQQYYRGKIVALGCIAKEDRKQERMFRRTDQVIPQEQVDQDIHDCILSDKKRARALGLLDEDGATIPATPPEAALPPPADTPPQAPLFQMPPAEGSDQPPKTIPLFPPPDSDLFPPQPFGGDNSSEPIPS